VAPFYISETITSWILHSDLSGKMTSSELSKGLNPGKRQTIKVFTNKQTNKHAKQTRKPTIDQLSKDEVRYCVDSNSSSADPAHNLFEGGVRISRAANLNNRTYMQSHTLTVVQGGRMETLGILICYTISKDLTTSKKPVVCSARCGIYYRLPCSWTACGVT